MFLKATLFRYLFRYSLFLFVYTLCGPVEILGNTLKSTTDSLHQVLKETDDAGKRMETYRTLASLYSCLPNEELYLKELQKIALQADSLDAYYSSFLSLACYYCNTNKGDSLFAVLDKVKSVAKERKDQPNVIFDIRSRICRYYLINQEYEVAMNEIVGLLRDVEKANYEQGLIMANENLGLVLLLIGRNKESIAPLEKCLFLLQKREDQLMYGIEILSYLSNASLHLNEVDRIKPFLDYYQDRLERFLHTTPPFTIVEDEENKSSHCMLYSLWLNYYVGKKMKKEAEEILPKASRYVKEIFDPGYTSVYYLALARYFHFIKDYARAIESIDTTLQLDYLLEALEQKIAILLDAGKIDEVSDMYIEVTTLVNKQNVAMYKRQIDQLHIFHNLIEKEKEEQFLQNQRIEITHKQQQLIVLFIFTCILIIILIGVIQYALRIRTLRNALEKEQNSLRETSEHLRLAKDKAVKADQIKSEFVANVSHEVRTPLNAIVGFFALLNEAEEEEQGEFIKIINENTDLLLKLVNDVLDLSKLESDSFTFNIEDVDLLLSCQEVLNSIHNRCADKVKLTFTHPETPLILRTDSSRFQQLLLNLLINATKYTEEGEINLDYKIDEEANQLIFSVTDTGCGIPPDKQKIIFNRFEKVDSFKQGVGLGLPICSEIAKRLGGYVFLDVQYTLGARFIVKLPLQ